MELIRNSCGRDRIIQFDPEDWSFVKLFTWTITQNGNKFYAKAVKKGHWSYYLHRLIMGVQDPTIKVDHEDGNGLNCHKSNLRVATQSQNLHNLLRQTGVTFNKEKGLWKSRICVDNKETFFGYFLTAAEATAEWHKKVPLLFPHLKEFIMQPNEGDSDV